MSVLASEEDALFRAVLTAPDDDAPRLQWADWLTENGYAGYADYLRRAVSDGDKLVYFGEGERANLVRYKDDCVNTGLDWQFWLAPWWFGISHILHRGHVAAVRCRNLRTFRAACDGENWPYLGRRPWRPTPNTDKPAGLKLFDFCPIVSVIIPPDPFEGIHINQPIRIRLVVERNGLRYWKVEVDDWPDLVSNNIHFKDQHEAAAGLNLALVNYGRAQAGLPDLEYVSSKSSKMRVGRPYHEELLESLLPGYSD